MVEKVEKLENGYYGPCVGIADSGDAPWAELIGLSLSGIWG